MKRFIILLLALVSVILLNVHLYFQYGFMPLLLKADTINSYLHYEDYIVSDFEEFIPIITPDTPDVEIYYNVDISFYYEVDYCPSNNDIATIFFRLATFDMPSYDLVGQFGDNSLLECITPYDTYQKQLSIPLSQVLGTAYLTTKNYLLDLSDISRLRFDNLIAFRFQDYPLMWGHNLTIIDLNIKTNIEYRFNNTYLMSTFLLASDHIDNYTNTGSPFNGVHRPYVLWAETLKDRYNVYNSTVENFNLLLHYAVTIPDVDTALVVNSIGTGYENNSGTDKVLTAFNGESYYGENWEITTFNASPMGTPFDDAVIDTTPNYASCNEGLFGWPVECTIDGQGVSSFQAMANDVWEWLSKDSPIVSDLLAMASSGFQWLDNSLQFLGFFNPTTLLGAGIWVGVAVLLIAYAFNGGE